MHDIWEKDGLNKLGASICFVDPISFVYHLVSVMLIDISQKDAESCSKKILQELNKRLGVEKEDVYRSVNDTTNSAMATGRKLVSDTEEGEKDAKCKMHVLDLIMEHALGQITRTKNYKVVDSFPECLEVITKAKKLVDWLYSKKNKARFKRFIDLVIARKVNDGNAPRKISLPGDTRVAGISTFFEDLLCSFFEIRLFTGTQEAAPNIHMHFLVNQVQ